MTENTHSSGSFCMITVESHSMEFFKLFGPYLLVETELPTRPQHTGFSIRFFSEERAFY